MFEVKYLSEYEHRNSAQFENKYIAERCFQNKQDANHVYVSLWKDGKCVKVAEKIGNKWYISFIEE